MQALNTKTGKQVTVTVEGVKGAPRYIATTADEIRVVCALGTDGVLRGSEGVSAVVVQLSCSEEYDLLVEAAALPYRQTASRARFAKR